MSGGGHDLVIMAAKIYDGTGSPWYRADVAVTGGRIVHVGSLRGEEARETLIADGLTLAPGFFDVHTHSDFSLLANPFPKSQLLQGITGEVDGQRGYTAYPIADTSYGAIL